MNNYRNLNDNELSEIFGGSKRNGDLFLSGVAGAAEGVTTCATNGIIVPAHLAVCGVVGAGLNMVFPR
ncbi:Blp family class II bacteriocin [Streptococcus orisasini]